MKTIHYFLLFTLIIYGAFGCKATRDVVYLQDSEMTTSEEYAVQNTPMYDARIMPKDILTITVTTTDPDASRPFNVTVPVSNPNNASIYTQAQLNTYLVDNGGKVNFPVLGMIELKGLTNREAEEKIKELLKPYIKEDPLVVVKFGNYKISVMGEVSNPGSFTVSQEKINIFEALAMAGDMTIYGKRNNVKVIREDADGNKKILQMNLNDPYVIFSSDYYLQQNDVVIVEPNKVRTQSAQIGPATALWMSGISIAISITTMVINILR